MPKTKTPSIVALVPFFNEGKRIVDTAELLTHVEGLDGVVCVDDGSTDTGSKSLQQQFPQIKLIKLKKNRGKSGAVLAGLEEIDTDYVLLCDADLVSLDAGELAHGVRIVHAHSSVDMLIFQRVNSIKSTKWMKADILYSGERIVRLKDLKKVFGKFKPKGFELEGALNKYMLDHKKNIIIAPLSAVSTYKLRKWGLAKGIWLEVLANKDMLKSAGLKGYIKQVRYLSDPKLRDLNWDVRLRLVQAKQKWAQ